MSLFTIGAIGILVLVFALYRQIFGRSSKSRIYMSKKHHNNPIIFVVLGLVMIGYAGYTAFNPEPDVVPKVFDIGIRDLFGGTTPLALTLLNPFFSIGVFVLSVGLNDQIVLRKLDQAGLLTIPSNFSLRQLTRDDNGSKRWKLNYQFLDGFQGEKQLKAVEYEDWKTAIDAVVGNTLSPDQIGYYFLIQYLPDTPGNYRLWKTDEFPESSIAISRRLMMDHHDGWSKFEEIFSNIQRENYPITSTASDSLHNEVPVIELKIGDGRVQKVVIKILFWGFILSLFLFMAFVMGWLDFLSG
jgi:hypothetical protein